ncbi:hypothetical protein CYMTET_20621 [Cymbomonas tetramitiformis]|uniref:Uncharacterized protein n=1 Tax=Cymbomonas tetramitiformis TaxID=36881 RepID=A0AAE0G3N4_9CHLO|nr:hypothetical protein CYMTET_40115 [Cymbomonas tetramitiformis]KAK3271015.1 hypothetical protein CYMTET_20621 [Cymbomonas tetramitiformis]
MDTTRALNYPKQNYHCYAPQHARRMERFFNAPGEVAAQNNAFDLLTQRTPTTTVLFAVSLFAIVFVVMYSMRFLPSYYFDLYSDDVRFFDAYVIDDVYKSLVALSCTTFLTGINVYVRRKVLSWQINYLNSPHVPRKDLDSDARIQCTMMLHTVFLSLSSAVTLFFMFSNFWFLMAQTVGTIVVTAIMTGRFLSEKENAADCFSSDEDDATETVHAPCTNEAYVRTLKAANTGARRVLRV